MSPLRRLLMCFVLFALSACSKGGLSNFATGARYFEGKGVPKDDVEAYAWFNIAAVSIQNAKKIRDTLNLTPEEKAQAQKRSTELFNEIEARKKAAGK